MTNFFCSMLICSYYPYNYIFIYLSIYISIHLYIYAFTHLYIYIFIYLYIYILIWTYKYIILRNILSCGFFQSSLSLQRPPKQYSQKSFQFRRPQSTLFYSHVLTPRNEIIFALNFSVNSSTNVLFRKNSFHYFFFIFKDGD